MLSSDLCNYDPKQRLVFTADASDHVVVSLISHVWPNETERPIAHVSPTLPSTGNYRQTEEDAQETILGVKKFHKYISRCSFTLLTDYKPLQSIPLHTANRLQHWSIGLLAGNAPFNRGLLLNIGAREALLRDPTVDCFVFHDVDLLPENSDNLYVCDNHLRHLAAGVDEFRFHVPFLNYAGGVSSLSKENMIKVCSPRYLYFPNPISVDNTDHTELFRNLSRRAYLPFHPVNRQR
ncbi:unnamed protein product [Echinostoma caproni]|uniref:Glyco_transf_7N domain-containing protein n=1 Tax=Echinostoma caproni TaxID=27848 RepID=A0A183B4H9_9TREM|nr:unnamed protein product [Echinostoma caproni]